MHTNTTSRPSNARKMRPFQGQPANLPQVPSPDKFQTKTPANKGFSEPPQQNFNRGARIRTGDLADPNGARYQAAPRPDAETSIPHRYGPRRMPAELTEILRELDALLNPEAFEDYCPNGLQVPGSEQVATLATGVSAHMELFERAREENAELILTHHGIFWGTGPAAPIDAAQKRRLKLLFDANMSLAAYHLPLDAHPEMGNNALLASALG